ncbi:hypothetical protein BHE16_00920 [Neomicrococcus aestuarii]|uniref:Uncharacterized protein n=1 Tax=Neomicrococcus aestuarii TaxID=556325 RepID=A0A1L2ZLB1_9MICC|nr:hypothetical protein BHE16_00920 [Neomicrococcus aestuarii]MBB5513858.1 hypothetical protein [Neomicrococcus aestuarii]
MERNFAPPAIWVLLSIQQKHVDEITHAVCDADPLFFVNQHERIQGNATTTWTRLPLIQVIPPFLARKHDSLAPVRHRTSDELYRYRKGPP